MKKNRILILSTATLLLGLASCGGNSSAPTSQQEPASNSQVAPTSEASASEAPTSVAPSSQAPASEDISAQSSLAEWVDYVHDGSVKLGLDFTGRTFFEDGLEKVTLYNTIDGDTAHFKGADGKVIKARFYGIDTPESTGKIQPYGYDASDFTSNLLKEADKNGTIVVSTAQNDYGKPKADSTGSRYVSLVWVNTEKKNASLDELYCVNLWVVQEGLSWVKAVSDMPQYQETFYAAERQAKNYKLKLHSNEDDPRMPKGDYENVSLLDLKKALLDEIEAHKQGQEDYVNPFDNKKVLVQGTVNGYANNTLYLADWCYYLDESGSPIDDSGMEPGVNGEYASINIFTGAGSIDTMFTTVGNYIQVCGVALDSKFGFQITGASFMPAPRAPEDARVIIPAEENTGDHAIHIFEMTADELQNEVNTENFVMLNCRVSMTTPLTCTRFYKSDDGDITLTFERPYTFRVYFTFKYKPFYPEQKNITWTQEEHFLNKKFTVTGVYARYEAKSGAVSMQIYPDTTTDLVYVAD